MEVYGLACKNVIILFELQNTFMSYIILQKQILWEAHIGGWKVKQRLIFQAASFTSRELRLLTRNAAQKYTKTYYVTLMVQESTREVT